MHSMVDALLSNEEHPEARLDQEDLPIEEPQASLEHRTKIVSIVLNIHIQTTQAGVTIEEIEVEELIIDINIRSIHIRQQVGASQAIFIHQC